jgi:ketosteroid isomerase-like protein
MSKEKQIEIERTLASFIHDFNNLDMEKLSTYFSNDATTFPRVVMSSKSSRDITLSDYLRQEGAGPDMIMENFASQLKAQISGPPYMRLEPKDVVIQVFDEVAIVTFHLLSEVRLSRRTFVFIREDNVWKIIHIHASNVHLD